VWRFFDYKTQFPTSAGSSIAFSAATATTAPGLATAKRVTLVTQTSTNASFLGADVSAAFADDSSAIRSAEWLRLFMAFTPTTDTNYTPYLTDWRQAYDCVDAE
jgi:hypothetical protein